MQIEWDKLRGASSEVTGQTATITRAGLVTGVEGSATADPSILLRATSSVFDSAAGGYAGLPKTHVLTRLTLFPGANTNDLSSTATFTIPTVNFVNDKSRVMTWLVEVSSSLQMETEQIDTLGNPIQTIYIPDGGENSDNPAGRFTADMSVLRPRKVLTITGVASIGGFAFEDAIGKVNAKPWSGFRKPGFWLCTDVQSKMLNAFPQYGSSASFIYSNRASFTSKVIRDWSHFAIHRGPTGRIPKDMTKPGTTAKIQQLVYKTDYNVGQITPNDAGGVNGVVKAGLYELADFKKIFNFNLDDFLT